MAALAFSSAALKPRLSAKQSLGFRLWSLGFRVLGFRVLGFRVLGFRVLGFRVWGFRVLGFRV